MPEIRVERIHFGFLVAPDGTRDAGPFDGTPSHEFLGQKRRPAAYGAWS